MFIRRLPRFTYHEPDSVEETVGLLAKYGEKAKILAGGTELLVKMKRREVVPDHVINLKRARDVAEIGIQRTEAGELKVGALVSIFEMERDAAIRTSFRCLFDAAKVFGTPQIRSLATIGGNIANAAPSADFAAPLLCMGAFVEVRGLDGVREIPLDSFFLGPEETVLSVTDVIISFRIPKPGQYSSSCYLKMMRRTASDLAVAGVAVYLELENDYRRCKDVRIALATAGPTPLRAYQGENRLKGNELSDALIEEVASAVAFSDARPRTTWRGSEWYRREVIRAFVKRALRNLWSEIREKGERRL